MEKEQPSSEMIAQVLLTQEILDLRMDLNKHQETMNELIKNQKKELQSVTDVTETKKHTQQKKDKRALWIWLFFLVVILGGVSYFTYWLITSIFAFTESSKSNFIAEFGIEKGTRIWVSLSDSVKKTFELVSLVFFVVGIFSNIVFSEIYKTMVELWKK